LRKFHAVILSAVAACAAAGVWAQTTEEDFNRARLQSGQDLYEEKKYLEAIDQFRVAAFGYLDQPAMLSECLVRLTIAQLAAGKTADADATIQRFVEIERRFPSYPEPGLEPPIRTAFQSLLLRQVPQATLLSVPTLAVLVETEEQKIMKLPPATRVKLLEGAAKREPGSARWLVLLAQESLAAGEPKDAEKWASKALALDPNNAEALALRARARTARRDYEDALKDLGALPQGELEKKPELYADQFVCLVEVKQWPAAEEAASRVPSDQSRRPDVMRAQQKLSAELQRTGKTAAAPKAAARPADPSPGSSAAQVAARSSEALAESRRLVSAGKAGDAEKVLAAAVAADPKNRELRLALLEAACLSRAYPTAVAQIPLVQPFGGSEAASMFYAAVALFESGRKDEAREYFDRAKPSVSGPLVDEYARKISSAQ
jgi:tetratricopeptide (TPR) repeat protein